MARKPKEALPGAVGRARKLAFKEGDEVWVRAKVTRIAPNNGSPDYTMVTVELPTKHKDTIWVRDDDECDPIRRDQP